ncbi:MAG TPA: L,D-transpeptidase [Roseiarcus sp.]|jgi:lipoprotein-anchoring transpeptidase ErfK/SrfK
MRGIILASVGLIAGLVFASNGAQAAADISVFSYPPAVDNYDQAPVAAPIPREMVDYDGPYSPGSIIINTGERRLYFVLPGHQAMKYAIGVGRPGFEWTGVSHIANKREWPDWTPPQEMLKRRPDLPRHMEGGIDNPLGARAMYIAGTLYRIHGSNEPDTIGEAVSSGCIRMTNDDVTDLYDRAKVGATVVVLRGASTEPDAVSAGLEEGRAAAQENNN